MSPIGGFGYAGSVQPRYTPPRPWTFLSDEEVAALAPFFAHGGAGRPTFDIRARLDAIFWMACHDRYWRELPPALGPWDTAHRQFRRWAHRGLWGLWGRLLVECALPNGNPVIKRLEHWICRAFRRGTRVMGLRAIVLARRLGLYSALNAPPWCLPDPDLSEACIPLFRRAAQRLLKRPDLRTIRLMKGLHLACGGMRRISRHMAPP